MENPFIERMRKHLKAVPVLLVAIEEEVVSRKPESGKWSKKEILGHLADSALYNLGRFTQIRFCEPPYVIVPYPQAELVSANNYQSQNLGEILRLWMTLNQQILSVWESYSDEELKIPIENPKFENKGDLEWWIEDYTEHMEHHLNQILGAQYKDLNLWLTTADEGLDMLSKSEKPFVKLLEHGSMSVEYYVPEFEDLQTPHDQDELYVIDQGQGVFFNGGVRHAFEAGDVLFVSAGVEHRFELFSDDFATWVIFYGPKGGENGNLGSLERVNEN